MARVDLMMARGANFLLNAEPDGAGRMPAEAERILRRVGARYRSVGEAFRGTALDNGLTTNSDVLITRGGDTVYVHLNREPRTSSVILAPVEVLPRSAILLNSGDEVACDISRLPSLYRQPRPAALRLHGLPVEERVGEVLVIRLDFGPDLDELPKPRPAPTSTPRA